MLGTLLSSTYIASKDHSESKKLKTIFLLFTRVKKSFSTTILLLINFLIALIFKYELISIIIIIINEEPNSQLVNNNFKRFYNAFLLSEINDPNPLSLSARNVQGIIN